MPLALMESAHSHLIGTNGDNPAPDILEDWLTETQVNTERSRNELAKGSHQSITTIELPLTDSNTTPGLIEQGMLVEVQDITGDRQRPCLATSINASGVGTVIQSINLERHFHPLSISFDKIAFVNLLLDQW